MKNQLLLLTSVLFCSITFAQNVPQGINYQGVARDANGIEITNQTLTIKLSIISNSSTGTLIWEENHSVSTNDFGLFNAVIGGGTTTGFGSSSTFNAIDWGSTTHFLNVEMNGLNMGTTQLMSVPYALTSGTSEDNLWEEQNGDANLITNNMNATIGGSVDIGNNANISNNASIGGNSYIMGNVGIGTTNPIRGKLEITGNQQCCGGTQGDFWYYLYNVPNGQFQYYNGTDNFDISVYADGRFMGAGIHIFSDERIKDVIGLSDNSEDLSTLISLEVTDYKMKDKTKGDKPYKKVIAQQVIEVYPQSISLTTEVIPDIYQVASIDNGYISLENDLKSGEKVRIIFEDETSLLDVIHADNNGFKVSTDKSGKVFVYGREVDDFHSVDYESLSMLNVSATQELYKLILSQQKIIESLETEVSELQEIKEDVEILKNLIGIPTRINTSTMKSE